MFKIGKRSSTHQGANGGVLAVAARPGEEVEIHVANVAGNGVGRQVKSERMSSDCDEVSVEGM